MARSRPTTLTPEAEQRVKDGIDVLVGMFDATQTRLEHFAIVDNKLHRDRILWARQHHRTLYVPLNAAIKRSWARTSPPTPDNYDQQIPV